MSVFPFVLSILILLFVISLFFCFVWGGVVVSFMICIVLDLMISEGDYDNGFSRSGLICAFYYFLLAEFIVFLSFFFSVIWYLNESSQSMSLWSSVPVLGCSLLFSSSVLLDAFVEEGLNGWSMKFLEYVVCCGGLFIVVSFVEFILVRCSFLSNPHFSSCLIVLVFHLSHVVVGLVGLVWWGNNILWSSYWSDRFFYYRFDYVIKYWHFVDFVWLFVYTIVYFR